MQTKTGETFLQDPSFLVIRRDNIGDLVCTTPLIRALREHFPKARICILVNSYNRPVVENNPDIDAVYDYTKAKHRQKGETVLGVYGRRMRMMYALRRERFDYAIIAETGVAPRVLRTARIIRPRHIIGYTRPGQHGARHIDVAVQAGRQHLLHEVEHVFGLLKPLGIEGAPPPMRVYPAATAMTSARVVLAASELPREHIIGMHISARKISNRWSGGNFIALIRALHESHGAGFMLFWSPGSMSNPRHPGDDEKAQEILAGLRRVPVLPFPTERLDQLMAGLACCHQVICSDGGAMHIAAALGKPILCFFGKSGAAQWHPWGVRHVLLQPPTLDVADISVDEALSGYQRLLSMIHAGGARSAGEQGAG